VEEGRGHWALAEVLRRERDLDGAEREIQAALEIIAMMTPLDVPAALGTQCRIRLAQGRIAEARSVADEAFARCGAMGTCGFFRAGFVRLAHAEALEATGDHAAAHAAIRVARERVLAAADRVPDPRYRKSFLEDVPDNVRILTLARTWLGE
jgi:hypothetical protein